jgi:hypothetical protein
MSQPLKVAAFQVIISGRFWVITKGAGNRQAAPEPPGTAYNIRAESAPYAPARLEQNQRRRIEIYFEQDWPLKS